MTVFTFDTPVRAAVMVNDVEVNVGYSGQLEKTLRCFWFALHSCSVQIAPILCSVVFD